MFTIIGGDGKEYGPVSADQIRSWIAAGRANAETQAKAVGTEDWRRVGDFPEFGTAATAGMPPPMSDGRSSGPAPALGPIDIKVYADDLKARAAKIDVFDCLGRSFELWKANFGRLVGATLLVMVVQIGLGLIPILGALAGLFLNGVLYGGLYYYYLGIIRSEPREISDAFAGFSKAFVPLMLTSLLLSAMILVIIAPFIVPWVLLVARTMVESTGGLPPVPSGTMLISIGVCFALAMYFAVAWVFAFPLVIDKGLGPWTALEVSRRVVTGQWFRVFFVMMLGSLLAMLGLIAFVIGILVTMPLMIGAMMFAYEDLFNPRSDQRAS